jgi:tetratricopeptide (TPR) repeat protein
MEREITCPQLKTCVYLFLAALMVRLIYLSQYAASPFFAVPALDSLYHDLLASGIAHGHSEPSAFFRAPLYYYFLGAIYWVFGHSYWAARTVQALLGAASCVLLYKIGRRLFRPAVGLIAAGAMVLYGPLVFFDGELLTPVLEVFLDLSFVLLALKATATGKRQAWLAAGIVLGLAAITRPNTLVAAPLVLIWLWRRRDERPSLPSPIGRRSISAAVFLVGVMAAPGLVTCRNYAVSGDPIFIASQGGINLFLGNRPKADGFTPTTPHRYRFDGPYEDSVALFGQRAAEEAVGRRLLASEAQSYWVSRVLTWWRTEPVAALQITGKKWVLAWTHREIRNNHAYEFVRRECAPFLWLCPIGFWFAGPLGLLGMMLAWRSHPQTRWLIVFVLLYMASFVLFFVADRYRLPVVPLLLLFAAHALTWFREQHRTRDWRRLVLAAAALAGFAIYVNVDWYRTVTPATWALDYWSAGNRYKELGRFSEAEAQFRKALALDHQNADIWMNLGGVQYYSGRLTDAAQSFHQALALGPDNGSGYFNLAMCELQLGRRDIARRHLEQAVRLDPEHATARTELARLQTGG